MSNLIIEGANAVEPSEDRAIVEEGNDGGSELETQAIEDNNSNNLAP